MDADFEKKALMIGAVFSEDIKNSPASHSYLLSAIEYLSGKSYEVVINEGKEKGGSKKFLKVINRNYIPNKIVILKSSGNDFTGTGRLKEFIDSLEPVKNKTTLYICKNYYCELPITDVNELEKSLNIIDS